MNQSEALLICEEYRAEYGHPGLLEAMEAMQDAYERDELETRQRIAFRVAMAGFRRLLAPA